MEEQRKGELEGGLRERERGKKEDRRERSFSKLVINWTYKDYVQKMFDNKFITIGQKTIAKNKKKQNLDKQQ